MAVSIAGKAQANLANLTLELPLLGTSIAMLKTQLIMLMSGKISPSAQV